jgi:transcriptional regulator with XRE-family HTH domain
MGFGDRLKFAREAKGLSGDALGKFVGVKRATISHWEVERYAPGLHQLIALSKAVGVNMHWLATGDVGVILSEDEHKLIQAYQQRVVPNRR